MITVFSQFSLISLSTKLWRLSLSCLLLVFLQAWCWWAGDRWRECRCPGPVRRCGAAPGPRREPSSLPGSVPAGHGGFPPPGWTQKVPSSGLAAPWGRLVLLRAQHPVSVNSPPPAGDAHRCGDPVLLPPLLAHGWGASPEPRGRWLGGRRVCKGCHQAPKSQWSPPSSAGGTVWAYSTDTADAPELGKWGEGFRGSWEAALLWKTFAVPGECLVCFLGFIF